MRLVTRWLIALCLACCCSPAVLSAQTPEPLAYFGVAVDDQPVPGTDWLFGRPFASGFVAPAVNRNGTVIASFAGRTTDAFNSDRNGIVRFEFGLVTLPVKHFDPAPFVLGVPPVPTTLREFRFPNIADSGEFVFFSHNHIGVRHANGINTTALGKTEPGMATEATSFLYDRGFPLIAANGEVVSGPPPDSGGQPVDGIVVEAPGGPTTTPVKEGDVIDGLTLHGIDEGHIVINANGHIAFLADTTASILPEPALFSWTGGQTNLIVKKGDALPPGIPGMATNAVFKYILNARPSINVHGKIVFNAGITHPGGGVAASLWIYDLNTSTFELVVYADHDYPTTNVGTVQFVSPGNAMINAQDDVFFSTLTKPSEYGVWRWSSGTLTRLAAEGDTSPGAALPLDTLSLVSVNASGRVLFSGQLTDRSTDGLWFQDEDGNTRLAFVEGESFVDTVGRTNTLVGFEVLSGNGEDGWPRGFSDNYVIAIKGTLDTGKTGIFAVMPQANLTPSGKTYVWNGTFDSNWHTTQGGFCNWKDAHGVLWDVPPGTNGDEVCILNNADVVLDHEAVNLESITQMENPATLDRGSLTVSRNLTADAGVFDNLDLSGAAVAALQNASTFRGLTVKGTARLRTGDASDISNLELKDTGTLQCDGTVSLVQSNRWLSGTVTQTSSTNDTLWVEANAVLSLSNEGSGTRTLDGVLRISGNVIVDDPDSSLSGNGRVVVESAGRLDLRSGDLGTPAAGDAEPAIDVVGKLWKLESGVTTNPSTVRISGDLVQQSQGQLIVADGTLELGGENDFQGLLSVRADNRLRVLDSPAAILYDSEFAFGARASVEEGGVLEFSGTDLTVNRLPEFTGLGTVIFDCFSIWNISYTHTIRNLHYKRGLLDSGGVSAVLRIANRIDLSGSGTKELGGSAGAPMILMLLSGATMEFEAGSTLVLGKAGSLETGVGSTVIHPQGANLLVRELTALAVGGTYELDGAIRPDDDGPSGKSVSVHVKSGSIFNHNATGILVLDDSTVSGRLEIDGNYNLKNDLTAGNEHSTVLVDEGQLKCSGAGARGITAGEFECGPEGAVVVEAGAELAIDADGLPNVSFHFGLSNGNWSVTDAQLDLGSHDFRSLESNTIVKLTRTHPGATVRFNNLPGGSSVIPEFTNRGELEVHGSEITCAQRFQNHGELVLENAVLRLFDGASSNHTGGTVCGVANASIIMTTNAAFSGRGTIKNVTTIEGNAGFGGRLEVSQQNQPVTGVKEVTLDDVVVTPAHVFAFDGDNDLFFPGQEFTILQADSVQGAPQFNVDSSLLGRGVYFDIELQDSAGGGGKELVLIAREVPPSDYDEWKDLVFPPDAAADPFISGPLADPDRDERINLDEFFRGGAPGRSDPDPILLDVVEKGPDDRDVAISFKRAGYAKGVTITNEIRRSIAGSPEPLVPAMLLTETGRIETVEQAYQVPVTWGRAFLVQELRLDEEP